MRKKSFLLFILLIIITCSVSAKKRERKVDSKGYNITIVLENSKEKKLFLSGYYGGMEYLFDSATVKRGKFCFQEKDKEIPNGIYFIHNQDDKKLFYIIIDGSKNFSIYTNAESPLIYTTIEGSDANIAFLEYQKALASNADFDDAIYTETSPQSLLAKYLKTVVWEPHLLGEYKIMGNDTIYHSTREQYEYYVKHYYDDIDLSDSDLLRVPLTLDIEDYFISVLQGQDDQYIKNCAENLIQETFDKNNRPTECTNYYVKRIMQTFMGGDPRYDLAFVHLYDKYCINNSTIFSASEASLYKHLSDRKRRILIGKTIPPIQAYTSETEKFDTKKNTSDYIILWMWDPDCDDCVELTPKLNEFYRQFHETYNFEVYAISVTPDLDRWNQFIAEHDITWQNATYGFGMPNYDVVDYFDILTTPAVFLLDKNHKIIARHFSLDDIYEIFSQLSNN